MSEISNRLRAAIKESGLSHRELEVKTGIPHSAIQRYAAGTTDRIPISRLEVLAKALGTTAEYILGWDDEKAPATQESDERAAEFVKLFQLLTAEQQAIVISQIKGILSNS